jgi:hypothetical protein
MLQLKQIYFDEYTKGRCFNSPLVELIYNDKCTPFFENTIIAAQKPESGYFGVFSWAFGDKIRPLPDRSMVTPEYIAKNLNAEVISFFRRNQNKNVFDLCNRYHPGSELVFKGICDHVGYDSKLLSENTRFTVYMNTFVTTAEIYNQYIEELLKPAIEFMSSELQHILWKDSGYYKKAYMSDKLKRDLGVGYYPYHTFICERLFSLFLQKHKTISTIHLI